MANDLNKIQDRRAAILCSHIAAERRPILRAVRDEPTMPADSGWQFLCGIDNLDSKDSGKVWAVFEVLNFEPSLAKFIDLPPGTILAREDVKTPWEKQSGKF
jgi:hypothetical protein